MPAPEKPATTPSLPGALSTRTDGGIASKQVVRDITGYDPKSMETNESFSNIEGAAPMEAASQPSAFAGGAMPTQDGGQPMGVDTSHLPPLHGPSERPWEHVTSPGNINGEPDQRIAENAALVQRYLPDLIHATNLPGAPDSYRQFVNFLSRQAQAGPQ